MATAAEYRKLAEECFEWAREARDWGRARALRHAGPDLA